MPLLTRNIIIDTQYFLQNSLNFESEELKSLASLAQKNNVKVYLTDITEREIQKKIEDEIETALKKINTSDVRYLKSIPDFKKFLEVYDKKTAVNFVLTKYREFKDACHVKIIPSNEVTVLEVYEKYATSAPPFGPNDKKNEFPDAFALLAITNWIEKENTKAYLLSGDSDWEKFSTQVYNYVDPSLLYLPYLKDLPEFINLIYNTEEALKDLVKFGNDIIENKKEQIEKAIFEAFGWTTAFIADTDEKVEVFEVYRYKVKLVDKKIIRIERDLGIYALYFEISAVIKFGVLNSDSVYNLNLRTYTNPQHFIYTDQTFTIELECSFTFIDGLPVNFSMTRTNPPMIEFIPYEADKIIDLDEWIKQHQVILKGVENGNITSDGRGQQIFENFEAARKTFPSLDIHNNSEEFIRSPDNYIGGPIKYLTQKAAEIEFA